MGITSNVGFITMDENKNGEEVVATPAAAAEAEATAEAEAEPSQDAVKNELDRVRTPKTESEKAAFALQSNAKRARELGLDPKKVLGFDTPAPTKENEDSEIPAWYKEEQAKGQQKTAMQMADSIEDDNERELVKHQLTHVITSGTPEERLKVARGYINSVRNAKIVEETGRTTAARTHASAPGAPAKPSSDNFTPTSQEAAMMKAPFNLTADDIKKARTKEAAARG